MTLKAEIGGPVVFEGGGASLRFGWSAKNSGPGIATKITIQQELLIHGSRHEEQRFCKQVAQLPVDDMGTRFPQDDLFQISESAYLSQADIRKSMREHGLPNRHPEPMFDVFIIGCVAYSPTYDLKTRYFTGAIYKVLEGGIAIHIRSPGGPIASPDSFNKLSLQVPLGEGAIAGTIAK
jgi:hypothetical protein